MTLAMLYGIVLGLFLAIGASAATWAKDRRGPRTGSTVWFFLVGAPATVAGLLSLPLFVFAVPACFVLSGFVVQVHGWIQELASNLRARSTE